MEQRRRGIGPDLSVRFAQNLRRVRLEQGLTLDQVSWLIYDKGHEMTREVLSVLETGRPPRPGEREYRPRWVTIDEAMVICGVLGVSLDEMLRDYPGREPDGMRDGGAPLIYRDDQWGKQDGMVAGDGGGS